MKSYLILLPILFVGFLLNAQSNDTIFIKASDLKTEFLTNGTKQYLVYFKNGKNENRTSAQIWNRTIERKDYNGIKAITITQYWESSDTIVHTTTSVSEEKTMRPLYHDSWYKGRGTTTVDFLNQKLILNGNVISENEVDEKKKVSLETFKKALQQEVFNWHIDLEFFSILPYKKGAIFAIKFYEPGYINFKNEIYKVKGEDDFIGYDQKRIPCWLLSHGDKGNEEIYWVSKETQEILMLDQEINGTFYRYKIKLPYTP
ncbi:hypothetical protein [Aequorivita antarctica]|uniref:DUF3108 domain-containing protein n=1 Tax=Aequorivita antarctica TaxID=153266 RepID=A0A5C6YZY5_9FLAO|nr:hypothetical protein [Aequorivita antarctica]TXD73281.1 hypothetical protein ESU54_09085 [Aequorivita antarctica]SRX76035.1 hypothetical protein AEQU3_03033 [Aequorivita antarctica]